MQLNAVAADRDGIACGFRRLPGQIPDFIGCQRTQRIVVLHARLVCEHLAGGPDGARSDNVGGAATIEMMGDAANVQELHDDTTILRMDGIDHLPSGTHLIGVVDAGGARVAQPSNDICVASVMIRPSLSRCALYPVLCWRARARCWRERVSGAITTQFESFIASRVTGSKSDAV
jgi:hypothetical protein